jgi:hypothetical protein
LASEWSNSPIIFESDCANVVKDQKRDRNRRHTLEASTPILLSQLLFSQGGGVF